MVGSRLNSYRRLHCGKHRSGVPYLCRFRQTTDTRQASSQGCDRWSLGLEDGDKVVVGANFLIDADSNLKAVLVEIGGRGSSGCRVRHCRRGTRRGKSPKATARRKLDARVGTLCATVVCRQRARRPQVRTPSPRRAALTERSHPVLCWGSPTNGRHETR